MTRVLVGGVFDLFHKGHEYFLRESRKLGDELIVVVASDRIGALKGAHESQEIRAAKVMKSGLADRVIRGYSERNFMRIVKEVKPDIIAIGYDQPEPPFKEELKKMGIKIVRIDKLDGYSSTKIRSKIGRNGP